MIVVRNLYVSTQNEDFGVKCDHRLISLAIQILETRVGSRYNCAMKMEKPFGLFFSLILFSGAPAVADGSTPVLSEVFFQLAQLGEAASACRSCYPAPKGCSYLVCTIRMRSKADQYFRTGESEKAAKLFHKAYLASELDRNRPVRFYSGADSTESSSTTCRVKSIS